MKGFPFRNSDLSSVAECAEQLHQHHEQVDEVEIEAQRPRLYVPQDPCRRDLNTKRRVPSSSCKAWMTVVFLAASSGRKEMRDAQTARRDPPPWHLPHEVPPACPAIDRAQCGYRHAFLKRLLNQPRYCAHHNLPHPLQLSRLASALGRATYSRVPIWSRYSGCHPSPGRAFCEACRRRRR